jgi:hypothetical protein
VLYLVARLIIKPIDLFLDTLQEYFSSGAPSKFFPTFPFLFSYNPQDRYLQGNFGPVHKEYTTYSLPITHGAFPSDLAGEFVRNGPNAVYVIENQWGWRRKEKERKS